MKIFYKIFSKEEGYWKKVECEIRDPKGKEIEVVEAEVVRAVVSGLTQQIGYQLTDVLFKNQDFMDKLIDECLKNELLKSAMAKAIEESTRQHMKNMMGYR